MTSSTGSSPSFQRFQQTESGSGESIVSAMGLVTLLLADSEVGKEDILNFYGPYGVTPDRVKVLPFISACYLALNVPKSERQRVQAMYSLPERCVFYPAQLWIHKNHIRIVQALGLLKQAHQLKIPVVFCGSYDGAIRESTFREVMRFSSQLGLEGGKRSQGVKFISP